jgi:hypothetical protein
MRPNPWFEQRAGNQLGVKCQRFQPGTGLAVGMKTYLLQNLSHDFNPADTPNSLGLSPENKGLNRVVSWAR